MPCKVRGPAARGLPRRCAASSARRALGAALLAPVAEALERVLAETNAARAKIEEALAATAFEPSELERAEERLFALRALARKHKVAVDDLPDRCDAARSRAGRARESERPRSTSCEAATARGAQGLRGRCRCAERGAAGSGGAARRGGLAPSLRRSKLEKAALLHQRSRPWHRPRAARAASTACAFYRAHQSRHGARTVDEGRLGRRARAPDPRAQGGARGARLGADPRLRRGRCRRRRRHRCRGRRAAGEARRARAGAGRDPRPAGGGGRRSSIC